MKKLFGILFIATLLVTATSHAQSQKSGYVKLSPTEFKAQLAKDNGFLMDVRTPEEYMKESIKGAKLCNINDENFGAILEMLDKTRPVYVYCETGVRSAKAADMMVKEGFKKVVHLEGGLAAYKAAKLETFSQTKQVAK
jgi:rhodanese-related sulfurtransferase